MPERFGNWLSGIGPYWTDASQPEAERYHGVADDEWCADCGESLPCQCDAHYEEHENGEGDD